jgi:hypothetical protein
MAGTHRNPATAQERARRKGCGKMCFTTSDVTSTWAYTLGLYSDTTKLIALNAPYGYSFIGRTPKRGLVYKLKILYLPAASAGAGGEWLEAGSYSDFITFTVTAM